MAKTNGVACAKANQHRWLIAFTFLGNKARQHASEHVDDPSPKSFFQVPLDSGMRTPIIRAQRAPQNARAFAFHA